MSLVNPNIRTIAPTSDIEYDGYVGPLSKSEGISHRAQMREKLHSKVNKYTQRMKDQRTKLKYISHLMNRHDLYKSNDDMETMAPVYPLETNESISPAPAPSMPGRSRPKLNLQINIDSMSMNDLSPIEEDDVMIRPPEGSDDIIQPDQLSTSYYEMVDSTAPRRRQSSVKLSVKAMKDVDFHTVARDGPSNLGKHTIRLRMLGKGAGGTVRLGFYAPSMKLVAIKDVYVLNENDREMLKNELQALHKNLARIDMNRNYASHTTGSWHHVRSNFKRLIGRSVTSPYLVGFYGAYVTPSRNSLSVVMEYMDMGSMEDLINGHFVAPEAVLRHCAFCCMKALAYMHSNRMMHRDIKPANILINRAGQFKVADFGLAMTLAKSEPTSSEFQGTVMYMSPERLHGQEYSYVSDTWSLGVSLYKFATGAYPFKASDGFFGLEESIMYDPLPPLPNRFSTDLRDFVSKLMTRDPDERLAAHDALKHPFLKDYEGSPEFFNFRKLWKIYPAPTIIKAREVTKIAAFVADRAKRYPFVLPPGIEDVHVCCGESQQSAFTKTARLLTGQWIYDREGEDYIDLLHQLAANCRVPYELLHTCIDDELRRC